MECPAPHLHDSQTINQNPKSHIKESTEKKPMEKFQEVIFKLAETHPNGPLTPVRRTLLQDCLNQFVSQYKTPDHPPYSAIIERALQELNEKRGSSEDSISQFLVKEYDNLPWAHSLLLKHHLGKLCESGDIVVTCCKRYMLAGENPCLNSSTEVKRKKPARRKCKWDWERERNKQRKRQLMKKRRNQQKDEKVEKHQEEYNEKEQQEFGPSEKARGQEKPELSSPTRPAGFESTGVENVSHLGSTQPELASAEEVFESKQQPGRSNLSLTLNQLDFPLTDEQETGELLQLLLPRQEEVSEVKQLRRSLRARPVTLRTHHCPEPEEPPKAIHRHRERLSNQKPGNRRDLEPIKAALAGEVQHQLKEGRPLTCQRQRMLVKPKGDAANVENLTLADDCKGQDLQRTSKPADCTFVCEKMEELRRDEKLLGGNSKQKLQEEEPQKLPERRSARIRLRLLRQHQTT